MENEKKLYKLIKENRGLLLDLFSIIEDLSEEENSIIDEMMRLTSEVN